MMSLFIDFKDRVAQVEKYFELLKHTEAGYLFLSDKSNTFTVDNDLTRILKANSFLLLYNLIESTVKSGLWEMFEVIKSKNISFVSLTNELKEIWIMNKIQFDFKTKDETINKKVLSILDDAINTTVEYYKSKNNVKFQAGNLDIKEITKTFKLHGITPVGVHKHIEDSFKATKKNRNGLAHGDVTFIDCGKDYSYVDLRRIKCHIVRYLLRCISLIIEYVTKESYLKPKAIVLATSTPTATPIPVSG